MTPWLQCEHVSALTASASSFLGTPSLFLGETASLSLQPSASIGDWMSEAHPHQEPLTRPESWAAFPGTFNWRQAEGEEVGNFDQVAFLFSSFLLVAKL